MLGDNSKTRRPPAEQKRCWNCRGETSIDRKIACDRALPACNNCTQRREHCRGYGLKLSWPKHSDKRRSVHAKDHFLAGVPYGDLDFVNTAPEDIEALRNPALLWQRPTSYDLWWLARLPSLTVATARSTNADRPHIPVSLLVSSSSDLDDLYGLLLRLSFQDDELPSLATRHALSALSYQHLDKRKAALHQTQAIRTLQRAIEAFSASRAFQTMAASMLLSIYETINFDSSEPSWSIFFCGTKTIAKGVTHTNDSYYGDDALMLDWIFYLDVMYKFSIRHWLKKNRDQIILAEGKKIISKAVFEPERQVILPTLGCSLEMLDLVCQAIDAVLGRDDPLYLSETHVKTIRSLEIRTQTVVQHSSGFQFGGAEDGVAHTAELYRLATLIYLSRVARGGTRDSEPSKGLVNEAYVLLQKMHLCDRPWPLFVIGLEAHTEEQRRVMLGLLDASVKARPIGNLVMVSRMMITVYRRNRLFFVDW